MKNMALVFLTRMFVLLGVAGLLGAAGKRTPVANIRTLYIQCPVPWLRERVGGLLDDRCACVTAGRQQADATVQVSYVNAPGTMKPIRNIRVTLELLRGGKAVWSDQRDWPAGGPSMPPRKAALGIAAGLVGELEGAVRFTGRRDVTRAFLRSVSRIAIVPSGSWDQAVAAKWARSLARGGCTQTVVAKQNAGAILQHVEVSSSQVNHIGEVDVECASGPDGTFCSDNLGGSSSVTCEGENCSGSSTTGSPGDARPDIEIVAPTFAWMFIDPRTGQRIGRWTSQRDSLRSVKRALGCK